MQSPELRAIIDMIPADFASPGADYREVRTTMAPFHNHPVSDDTEVTIISLGGRDCGLYRGREQAPTATRILHIHGGALVSCPLSVYHFYGEMICKALRRPVLMPDYRLAPEHPCPAAIDDCLAAYRGLLDSGTSAENIVVMGESCGGGLAICALLRARDEQLPMPAAFVSLTGWFDLSAANPPTSREPFLTPEWVRNRGREFTAGAVPLDDPRVSPCYADLKGLPPLYLQIGQYDTMAPGALELARRATLAGVRVRMESWPGMIQGWHGLLNHGVPEAAAAWQDIREHVDEALTTRP